MAPESLIAITLYLRQILISRTIAAKTPELGVPGGTLAGWVQDYQEDKGEAFPGKGYLKASEVEVARLTKELAIVREERDILKKALGIFSSVRK
jgi:transposase